MNLRRMVSATEEEIFGAGAAGAEPKAGEAEGASASSKRRFRSHQGRGRVRIRRPQLPDKIVGGAVLRNSKGNTVI